MPTGPVPPTRSAAAHLETVAVEVAENAAGLVRASVGRAVETRTKTSPTDTVTATDVQSEALIRRELIERCPGSSIAGEELSDDLGTNDVSWIVDPIDGTVNFLYDLPVIAVSIAATIGDRVVAGAVVDVLRGETFSAARGGGARRDGHGIRASSATDVNTALVGTGFSYASRRRAEQSEILVRLLPTVRDIRCMGSAALNMCWVACGRVDAYYEHDTKPYDYAAGALIASEAGARVELPEHNGLELSLASAPEISATLRSLITDR